MGKTLVGLQGPPASLTRMAARFSSPRLTITDDGNGMGYLQSSDFPSLVEDAQIIEVANRLIQIANSSMRQGDPQFFQPVSVRPMVVREDDTGKRTATVTVSDAQALATAETVTVVERFPDGTTRVIAAGPPVPPEPPHPRFEDVALDLFGDVAVDDALRFYSYRDNWAVNLYKVYEIVALDVGETKKGRKSTTSDNKEQFIQRGWDEIARQGWITEAEVTRFRGTVHSSDVLGDQARHAVQSRPVPAHPMNEDEAIKFIGAVLNKWFQQKWTEPS